MVVLPQAVEFGTRHLADGLPAVLDGVELVVGGLQALRFVVYQLAQFFKDLLFLFEVVLLCGFHLVDVFLSTFAVDAVYLAVGFGHAVVAAFVLVFVAAFFDEFVEGCFLGLFVGLGEAQFDGSYTVLDLGDVVGLQQFFEGFGQFLAAEGAVVDSGFLFDLSLWGRVVFGISLDGLLFGSCLWLVFSRFGFRFGGVALCVFSSWYCQRFGCLLGQGCLGFRLRILGFHCHVLHFFWFVHRMFNLCYNYLFFSRLMMFFGLWAV